MSSPRSKLLLISALIAVLAFAAHASGAGAASVARLLLALLAVAGGIVWWQRRQRAPASLPLAHRLQVLDRTGLSQRCALALVRVDGGEFLVAYGDGFAEIHPAKRLTAASARRPSPQPRRRVVKGGAR